MILTSLEMQGFKSFPEKTVLTFGKGITAVVGPNGSGKSNISDAVRWVLGEQSSKSLRGSKMEDVIFDGTKIRKAHGFAQVTLRLDNRDGTITGVDTDEVSVTRRYYRSGESEYKINGKTVRLKDVHELFMDTGLGRDGYSMVSQGKIADMISGRGKECREMFEEAAGISAYRYRRSDSLKKLAAAEENLVRLRDILFELESRIGPLKHQSEKAQKFLTLADEKKVLEIGLWLHKIHKLREDLIKQEDNLSIASGHYSEVEEELRTIEKQIEDLITETQQSNIKIDELRRSISELEEQGATASSDIAVLRSSIAHNNDTIERIIRAKNDSESSQTQLKKEIDTEDKLISQIKSIKDEKQEKLNSANDELAQINSQGHSLLSESETLSSKISSNTQQLAQCEASKATLLSAIEEVKERVETIDSVVVQRQETLKALQNELDRINELLRECLTAIESLNNSIDGFEMMLKGKNEKADALKRNLDDKKFDAQRMRSKIKMLTELEMSMEGYSGAVKQVIAQSKKGLLKGVHGTISQLISVENEYATAIETALGNAVQNIVTDTPYDAKSAIDFLKKSNSGRATFQPISEIKGKTLDAEGLDECFGYVDMAINLISCDSKYYEILSSLLGKVVVAEDLATAIEIAKKYSNSFKIVTLDGQVINAGGAMTGGSRSQSAGILTRNTEIESLKKSLAKLENEIGEMESDYKKLNGEIDSISSSLQQYKSELSKAQEEKIRLEGQLNLVAQQFETVKNNLDELLGEKGSADEKIAQLQKNYADALAFSESLKREIAECEEKLSNISQIRTEVSKRSSEISELITKLNLDIHLAERDLQARLQALNLLKARLVSHENRDREFDDEIDVIKNKNNEIEIRIAELTELTATLQTRIENAKAQIKSLQEKRGEFEKRSSELRILERNKSTEREKISGELARLEERKDSMRKEYDGTIDKLFEEYQLTKREAEAVGVIPENPRESQMRLQEIKNKIRALGSVNVSAIEEYKEVKERYEFMSTQVQDIEKSKKELIKLIDELTDKMSSQFREQFTKINKNFGETFSELFGGGHAEIILEDPADVLESAIDIKLQPPGKNVKRLDSLSGGEKGLSAIALLFAIMKVNPAPFCIFDEVEAALDDVNVTRYAKYVRRMTENTQFILITHRRGTMEEADVLYGITMQEQGVSKLLELKTAELAKKLGLTQ